MKYRELFFYKDYFQGFFDRQTISARKKILWTLKLIEELDFIPGSYFKHLANTDGLYEIRVQQGNNIFRIFCFFDEHQLIVVGHGFQKKTQKTPSDEIAKALKHKHQYYEEKKLNQS
ncbi:MAG: type II toxin-antitoxin system RelE/ParE family toxin [Sphingobacteriales bacterium]|nr:type II toxin-antitoxin system RelE/ParE family toxin [Sphingobacteriales bacterium]OJW03028.1 MAG: addiction module toxin RelE [Sphingobacteriales bacterium 44-61]